MIRQGVGVLGLILAMACAGSEIPAVEQAQPALEKAVRAIGSVPDVTGIIEDLASEGWILVSMAGPAEPRRVRVGYETNLQLGGGVAAHWGDLAVGRRVSVWLSDGSAEVPARLVMIEDELDG